MMSYALLRLPDGACGGQSVSSSELHLLPLALTMHTPKASLPFHVKHTQWRVSVRLYVCSEVYLLKSISPSTLYLIENLYENYLNIKAIETGNLVHIFPTLSSISYLPYVTCALQETSTQLCPLCSVTFLPQYSTISNDLPVISMVWLV